MDESTPADQIPNRNAPAPEADRVFVFLAELKRLEERMRHVCDHLGDKFDRLLDEDDPAQSTAGRLRTAAVAPGLKLPGRSGARQPPASVDELETAVRWFFFEERPSLLDPWTSFQSANASSEDRLRAFFLTLDPEERMQVAAAAAKVATASWLFYGTLPAPEFCKRLGSVLASAQESSKPGAEELPGANLS